MRTKTMQEALQEWIEKSPNKTPRNTLIYGRFDKTTYCHWNLKPNDIHEKDFVWTEEERGEP